MLVLMDLMICESRSCSSIVSGLLSLCDIPCQKSVEKNTSQGSYVSTSATPRLTLKNLHTIPYNKIIRNCMELSGILTVQALCVFSCKQNYGKTAKCFILVTFSLLSSSLFSVSLFTASYNIS